MWWKDEECKALWSLGWPLALGSLLEGAYGVIQVATIGHLLGKDAMAAISLAEAFMMLSQSFPLSSLGCLNTVCSQAIGSGNKMLAGYWLQTGMIVFTVGVIPVYILWWFLTDTVLEGIGMKHNLSSDAQRYARIAIPAYYLQGIAMGADQFYASIGITKATLAATVIGLAFSIGINLLFMGGLPGTSWDGMGLDGAPIGLLVSIIIQLILLNFFTSFKNAHVGYWPGFSWKEATKKSRMNEYLKLSIPTAIGSFIEEGQFQLLTVFTAHLGSDDIAAWSVIGMIWIQLVMASMGFGSAINMRVAQHVGSGDLTSCFKTIKYGTCIIALVSTLSGALIYFMRDHVGKIFTHDEDIIHIVRQACWLMACAIPMLCIGVVGLFVLDGQGRPSLGAGITAAGSWFLNVPFSALAVYKFGYGINGILFVITLGYAVSSLFSWVAIWFSDWDDLIKQAKKRSEIEGDEESQREGEEERSRDNTVQTTGIEAGSDVDKDDESGSEDDGDENQPLIVS
eukprot:TRINITY_DN11376_c0_g1_i1.p1 TRINITY_DN11376_c0_g1~~TRINITY_DN11376_c0_g1_i1.p1  ORF type:complete len:537 (+),score=62.05 TRINITY_DN11376_c0_g1_i1:79-1611(+)